MSLFQMYPVHNMQIFIIQHLVVTRNENPSILPGKRHDKYHETCTVSEGEDFCLLNTYKVKHIYQQFIIISKMLSNKITNSNNF